MAKDKGKLGREAETLRCSVLPKAGQIHTLQDREVKGRSRAKGWKYESGTWGRGLDGKHNFRHCQDIDIM